MNESTLQIAILCVAFGAFIGCIGTMVAEWIVCDLNEHKKKKARKTRCKKCGSTHPFKGERTDVMGRRTYYFGCPNCGTKTNEYQTEEDALNAWRKMNRRTK